MTSLGLSLLCFEVVDFLEEQLSQLLLVEMVLLELNLDFMEGVYFFLCLSDLLEEGVGEDGCVQVALRRIKPSGGFAALVRASNRRGDGLRESQQKRQESRSRPRGYFPIHLQGEQRAHRAREWHVLESGHAQSAGQQYELYPAGGKWRQSGGLLRSPVLVEGGRAIGHGNR